MGPGDLDLDLWGTSNVIVVSWLPHVMETGISSCSGRLVRLPT